MSTKKEVSERFIEAYNSLLKHGVITDKKDFATKLGISASMITEIYKGRSSVGVSALQNIVLLFNIDSNWLLTGAGEMLKNDSHINKNEIPKAMHSDNLSEGIPLIPLDAMAGCLTSEQTVLEYECDRYIVPMFKGADYLIPIKGTSMTPRYNSGDVVACQRVSMSELFFQWNKVYVVDTNQGPLIKRIKPGSDKDHIKFVSENTDYDPFELPISSINGIALVIGVIRLE